MHCVDGKDYSVFSILPPYNNLHAQLVNKTTNKQVNTGVTLTYESYADNTVAQTDPLYGSINTISSTKTNFWTYVSALFGAQPAPDHGLNLNDPTVSNRTPGTTPSPMQYSSGLGAFVAEGIPIMPVDDMGRKNFYPMIKVVAKDSATGAVLATARTVLPVSDEMTCKACHSTTTSTNAAAIAARPVAGWINDPDPEKDWKKNILRLHDEKKFADAANQTLYANALAQVGYNPAGLLATATAGQPVLCAACHLSNALQTSGVAGVRALTHALHTKHATVKDPATQVALGDATNRSSCYSCHPGSVTQCLRGAMGDALDASGNPAMSCQSCHGTMAQVGNTARAGWFNEPNCQSCHHDGTRELVGVNANGLPKVWTDATFATNANTPATGVSLFRFSKSHGNLQCEACHGATHAEYPSSHSQDNALSMDLQGHAGTVAECSACHVTVPNTVTGGPHGMHTTGDQWVSSHKSQARNNRTACAYCHGADFRGTPLSQIKVAKTINKKSFAAGHNMNCYDCHNGPNGD
ncbi:MAG: cytochrome c3 family protein [Gammaproteobacteria bacterium]|nr:cytochrome c3 family protein [Gammaproteobacteria bacterium]MBU1480416.1 cytochrome c3 family protein [Gammaproteobacteria bacterium]